MTPSILIHPDGLRIPARLDFGDFRAWLRSDAFPERGRIDFLAGEVDIDMSPEDITTHGTPKTAIAAALYNLLDDREPPGIVLSDRSRISSAAVGLSVEPDVVALLPETLASGRLRLVPKASQEVGRFVEIEGAPDLVVECVSDSSVAKDTRRLFELYHAAGVREYWLVDARRAPASFAIYATAAGGFQAVQADDAGYTRSPVLGRAFRFVRREAPGGFATFRLVAAP